MQTTIQLNEEKQEITIKINRAVIIFMQEEKRKRNHVKINSCSCNAKSKRCAITKHQVKLSPFPKKFKKE